MPLDLRCYEGGRRRNRGAGLLACVCLLLLASLPVSGCRARPWHDASPLLEQQVRRGESRPWWIDTVPAEPGVAWYGVGSDSFYDPVAMVQAPLDAEARARMSLAQRLRPVLRDAALVLLAHGEDGMPREAASDAARTLAERVAREVARDAALVELWQDREGRTIYALVRGLDSHVLFRLLAAVRDEWLSLAEPARAETARPDGDTDAGDVGAPRRLRARQAMSLLAQIPATPVRVTLTSRQTERGARAWMPREHLWADPTAWPARYEPGPEDSGILAGALVYTARNELALDRAEEAARLRLAIRSTLVVQEAIARLFDRETPGAQDPRRRQGAGLVLDVATAVGLEAATRAQVRSLALEPPGPMPELGNPRQSERRGGGGRGRDEPDPAWSKLGLDAALTESAWYTPQALRTRANRAMVGVNLRALAYLTAHGLEQRVAAGVLPPRRELVNALRRFIEQARRDVLSDDRPVRPLRSPIDTPLDESLPLLPPHTDEAFPQARSAAPAAESKSD